MMMINPPPVVGPRYFAFAGAIMALLVLLMFNPRELGGGAHDDLLASPLLAPSTMNMSDTTKNTKQALILGSPLSPPSTMNMSDTTKNTKQALILGSPMLSPYTNTKPTLLVHMGPHKTSTTFLQCVLSNMMDILALDNYVYFGRRVSECFKPGVTYDKDTLNSSPDFIWDRADGSRALYDTKDAFNPTFLNELRETHRQGKNAIILNEGFNGYTKEQTKLLMDEFSSNWNVKLILNYRRLYEALPSKYNEQHKPTKNSRHGDPSSLLWPGETNKEGVVGKSLGHYDTVDQGQWFLTIPVVSLQFARNSLNLEHPKHHTTHTFFIIFQYIHCVGGCIATTISISRFEHHPTT
jgi:hypothetical protein